MDYKEKVIALLKSQELSKEQKEKLEFIFPEITESDDERIRKALMQNLKERFGTEGNMGEGLDMPDVLAWFEKQGKITNEWSEMKINNIQTELQEMVDLKQKTEQGEQKPADNIESSAFKDKLLELFQKFRYIKEGVPTNGDIIDYVDSHIQELIDTVKNKPWSEEDEKMLNQVIEDIVKLAGPYVCYHKDVDWLKSFKERVQTKQEWKQENTGDLTDFENAMMHIGGSFFGENAGLDPNDTNAIKEQANFLSGLASSKEWNEEDEKYSSYICAVLECYYRLREDRSNTNGQENLDKARDWLYNRLKSIEHQNTWKPSDEQMELLREVQQALLGKDCHNRFVDFMYELKRLREK